MDNQPNTDGHITNDDIKYEMIDGLIKTLNKNGGYDIEKIKRAFLFAERCHEGQQRSSGEPYIVHPVAVAEIVAELQLDTDSICAAFLHDVIEDCSDVDLQLIKKEFGNQIADIVDGVTKLVHIPFETKADESIENLRKMFLAMSKDLRVIFIKLADRLHNMRTLNYRSEAKQRSIALETMHVYATLAHRLGIQKIKQELEILALQYLDPIGYGEVKTTIDKRYGESKDFLDLSQEKIAKKLVEYNIKYMMEGRIKSIYSMYRKMYNNLKSFDEIYDFYAVRIIVEIEIDCYTVLGIIHELYNSMPGRFKDYISTPKPNLYRSLHTTVIGREGIPFEVQIRTWEMHREAEYGLAAHWKYKSGEQTSETIDRKLQWIRTLLETEKDGDDPEEFFRPLKVDLFDDETFVFTPKGDVVSLPNGATPIDFAYAIHSAVGNKMVGAKVNGNIVPIDYVLSTGQIVDVLTSAASKGPSRDWLKIVKSSEAKNKIRQYFKKEMRSENIILGKAEIDREFRRFGKNFSEAQKEEIITNVAARLQLDVNDFYNNIGYGGLTISKIITKLRDEFIRVVKPVEQSQQQQKEHPKERTAHDKSSSVILDGQENCMVKFAKCCNPLPGDNIIGFITKGYGVSIHKYDCPNAVLGLQHIDDKDRWIVASWVSETIREEYGNFEATLNIYCKHSHQVIADVTKCIGDLKVSITSIVSHENGDSMHLTIGLKCSSITHLKNIITAIKKIKDIRDVTR